MRRRASIKRGGGGNCESGESINAGSVQENL